ncbi:unannotated protein [freshwater metagenome]|uniref:Unannotated protein n=1 Tax=freshwater metagenome TaxID=449393 RepID=A0A6J7L8X9_9ZZZZ|nr:glycosyltransferase [Actinomycetota bacterium]MSW14927.1 glycosyltransferase [Actinomycetota bacterium]MSW98266.1 glycosyltransferase [Actinomycetota bacterium]MSY81827.1 glycosyltransferase [Actinomycetota bacterium]MSZ45268.1 glycosyltransferase [Actinomycetota bacterium]
MGARPILLITNDLGPRAGGIETFILGLISQLDGSKLVIYTSSQEGDRDFDQALATKYGVEVIRDKSKVLLPTPRVFADIAGVLRRYQSTVIWYGASAPLAWLAPFFKKIGVERQIGMTHGHEVWWAKVWPFSWALRRMGNSLDIVTYLGSFTRDAIKNSLGPHPQLVHIAPGISVEHFVPSPSGEKPVDLVTRYNLEGKSVLLSVGRLVHRKGQDRLIQALPEIILQVPNVSLLLIGIGPREAHLRKLVRELKVESYVQFLGRVQYNELPRHIQLGDVFAMPSRSRFFGLEVEGLGIVYLEASACGLPVIAGKSGGAPDAIREGITGVSVDGNNVHEIAKAAIDLLNNPVRAKAMGAAGREWSVQQWNWPLWGEKFSALLRSK